MKSFNIILIILAGWFAISCAKQNMFKETPKQPISHLFAEPDTLLFRIAPGDRITVSVWGHDELSVGSVFGIYNSNEVFGKWVQVGQDGMITLPKLGRIYMEGLSKLQAEQVIVHALDSILVDPIVNIQVLNQQVSVLGEVIKPGKYNLTRDMTTIPEMITEAGGFDFYAQKKGVVLVRGEDEYLIDLTKTDASLFVHMPLKPGDLIYIPTRKGKELDKKSSTLISVTGIVTTILLIVTAVK